ncbi:MAG: DoxX family membrane protein, partial [Actinobacteria bacterium]|nr:DoxX family membrane protein [Actinomycetota bacterium]
MMTISTMANSHIMSDEMINGLNLGLLIIRVVVGLTLATHGLNKIFGGGKIAGTTGWFASMGMKMPKANAWLAALTEIGSGV